jgi:hypothetical protein
VMNHQTFHTTSVDKLTFHELNSSNVNSLHLRNPSRSKEPLKLISLIQISPQGD